MWTTFELILACIATWLISSFGTVFVIALCGANRRAHSKNIPTSDN